MALQRQASATTGWRDASLRARFVRVCCVGGASLAAAYLWAVLFGHGLSGLAGEPAVGNEPNLPDANAAFAAALGVYCLSPILAWWYGKWWIGGLKWISLTATIGLALFGFSQLVS